MRLRQALLILLAALFAHGVAYADKQRAKEHFKKGMARYTLEKWDDAIGEFEQGYTEEQDPAFLYNIAQAHRLAHRPKLAIDFYRKFLARRPDAPTRKEIEEQIAALEKTVAKTEAMAPNGKSEASTAKTTSATTPTTEAKLGKGAEAMGSTSGSSGPSTAIASSTAPVEKSPEVPPGAKPPTKDEQNPPPVAKKKTWPIWVGVAAGVLVAGGAATAAIFATRQTTTVLPPESLR